MSIRRTCLAAAVVATLFISSGCQIVPEAKPDPTQFYVLTHPNAVDLEVDGVMGITLGLYEVRLPNYLGDSRAMAVRNSGNRLTYRDFDRWAEPLDEGVERILSSSLTVTSEVGRVLTLPFPVGTERDYDLQVTVLASEGFDDGESQQILFALDYSLLTPDGELVTHGIYRAPRQSWDGTASSLARLLSFSVAASAEVIATAIADAP